MDSCKTCLNRYIACPSFHKPAWVSFLSFPTCQTTGLWFMWSRLVWPSWVQNLPSTHASARSPLSSTPKASQSQSCTLNSIIQTLQTILILVPCPYQMVCLKLMSQLKMLWPPYWLLERTLKLHSSDTWSISCCMLSANQDDPYDWVVCAVCDGLMHFTRALANHLKLPAISVCTNAAVSLLAFVLFPYL